MMNPVFAPFPLLTTDRLVLRAIDARDANEIFVIRSDEQILRYIDRAPAHSMAEVMAYIEQIKRSIAANETILWGITFKPHDTIIGTIALWQMEKENYRAEIGYALHPSCHRQGIMSEAMSVVLDYGFDVMHLHSVVANINPNNTASRQLLKKHGFQQEAYFRENYYFNGKFLDSEVYGLLRP